MKPGVRGTPPISGGLKGRRSPLRHPFRVHADGAVRPIPGVSPGLGSGGPSGRRWRSAASARTTRRLQPLLVKRPDGRVGLVGRVGHPTVRRLVLNQA